jgi:hypothetical protein
MYQPLKLLAPLATHNLYSLIGQSQNLSKEDWGSGSEKALDLVVASEEI